MPFNASIKITCPLSNSLFSGNLFTKREANTSVYPKAKKEYHLIKFAIVL